MQPEAIAIVVTATTGIVQIIKSIGMSSRFAPLVSLIIGIGMTLLFTHSLNLGTIFIGIVTGLTAGGLYSGTKATIAG